ncbi:uncharacterized protein A4U43_C01F9340, partial [Asparagus officinalis]
QDVGGVIVLMDDEARSMITTMNPLTRGREVLTMLAVQVNLGMEETGFNNGGRVHPVDSGRFSRREIQ